MMPGTSCSSSSPRRSPIGCLHSSAHPADAMTARRMAAVDAQFYWMSAKLHNDDFMLYAFDGEPADLGQAMEQVVHRARPCPELGLRVHEGSPLRYPRWVPTAIGPDWVVHHPLADCGWDGLLRAVIRL